MSISSRSQVARLYTPVQANDSGYASTVYLTDGTLYFCRVVESSVRERLTTGQIDGATTALLELADEITVPAQALFLVNGLLYRIKGVTRRPVKRVNQYAVEWLDQPMGDTELTADGSWKADGSRQANGLNPTLTL